MSLSFKERFTAAWPRMVIRLVIIAIVFIGLLWWERNKPQPVEQSTAVPAMRGDASQPAVVPVEQRHGVAIMFMLDYQQSDTAGDAVDAEAQRMVGAVKAELDRLTRYAGSHSQLPLRAGVMVTGFTQTQAAIPGATAGGDPMIVLPLAPPVPGNGLTQALADVRPSKTALLDEALNQAKIVLVHSGLSEAHVVVITTQSTVADQVRSHVGQDSAKDAGVKVHVVLIDGTAGKDQPLEGVVNALLEGH